MIEGSVQELERRRIQEIAQEYISKGYNVVIEPESDQLPDFLANYRPDIVARGYEETVIVEVKSRSSLAKSAYLRDIAQIVKQHPGFKFELVITNPDEGMLFTQRTITLSKADITKTIEELDELSKSDHSEASLLLAWATAEAVLRLLAQKEEIPLRGYAPLYLLKQLVTYAVISKEEYDSLLRIMKVRNALAHGFKTEEFDPKLLQELIEMIQHLLPSIPDPLFA